MTSALSSRYSPRSLDPAQLERLTVGREELLTRLERVVTDAVVTGQARFDLLVGPRGAGKSHCIGLLEARLQVSPQLAGRALVVAPPEELHPTSLVAFLAAVLREFPDDPEVGPIAEALRSLQRQQDGNQEQRAVDLIRGRLGGRALIILLENLDELFDMLGREGQQRLRNILQTQRRWSIIATSRSLSPAFVKYEAPFHGTFNQHQLEPLSPEQCRDMLAKLADAHGQTGLAELLRTDKGFARVRGIYHLLGGNARAMAFMFRHLDEHRLDHFELALADLADELKPYFQEQMTRVSPAQRAIMELLAESWRPLTVTEIAERGFISQGSVSGALRHLRRDALVQERKLGRERYYELGDPMHRLARANERPREAIDAFARVIRWWYADDSVSDFDVRRDYIFPKNIPSTVAADGDLGHTYLPVPTRHAWDMRRLPADQAIERARAVLRTQESPAARAALVLALERAGDEMAAVTELCAALGPHVQATIELTIVLSASAVQHSAGTTNLLELKVDSVVARALQLVERAWVRPNAQVREALLNAMVSASPAILRLLSDRVAHSFLLFSWTRERAWADLGLLLGRLRPTSATPSLEFQISIAMMRAWHYGRLTELMPSPASLVQLLDVLPEALRQTIFFASTAEAIDGSAWPSVLGGAPKSVITEAETYVISAPIIIEWVCVQTERTPDFEAPEPVTKSVDALLPLAVHSWLASRRSPRQLWHFAEREGAAAFLDANPALQSNSPREAVARLSEPERELIRKMLELYKDVEGLAELGFAPLSAASAAPPSRG